MSDFGTGLLAHLQAARRPPAESQTTPAAPVPPSLAALSAERAQLDAYAAELAAKELRLLEREAELEAEHRQMALALAKALLGAAKELNVPPPLDELAAARARRHGA